MRTICNATYLQRVIVLLLLLLLLLCDNLGPALAFSRDTRKTYLSCTWQDRYGDEHVDAESRYWVTAVPCFLAMLPDSRRYLPFNPADRKLHSFARSSESNRWSLSTVLKYSHIYVLARVETRVIYQVCCTVVKSLRLTAASQPIGVHTHAQIMCRQRASGGG